MNILYVTNDFPYPLTSGHLRHYFLIRELARHHRITLLSIVRPSFMDEHRAALEPFTERIATFVSSTQGRSRMQKARNQVAAFAERRPIDLAALELQKAAAELCRHIRFDAAVISGRRTTPALDALTGIPLIADLCDADSVRLLGALRRSALMQLPRILIEYLRVRRAERSLIRAAAHVLFAAQRDLHALIGHGIGRASVIPNGVDLAYWHRKRRERGQATMIFTGAMQYAPNTDAAIWLIERVLPLVRQERPDARLLIVGRDPPPPLERAGHLDGVVVTGAVPDMRPELERASVFVAPLRFGAGIQNKVLEALAMELPVVVTPLAAAGLRSREGVDPPLVTASEPAQIAQALLRELAACDRDRSARAAGRAFVHRHFSWQHSGQQLDAVLHEVVQRERWHQARNREVRRAPSAAQRAHR
ncbi:MAG TPA: glycosyltransferase [Longimicrobiales bacterium]|nr:glycosyltransferase [Longimicrobiales bacterium]